MVSRERRSWTPNEDQLLRTAVELEDPGTSNPSKWHAIAKHVPERTNKDCRKRWFAKMASDVVKGGWAPDEDERLVNAIEKHGTKWSMVATIVQSRNSDQCAKRWTDTLNPTIDRTSWTPEADALLIRAVEEHGKVWTKIVRTYFPGRTGLAAKNRYHSITRYNTTPRPYRPIITSPYGLHRRTESASSSSSNSPSPSALLTPDMSLAYLSSPPSSIADSFQSSPWDCFDDSTQEKSFGLLPPDPFIDTPAVFGTDPTLGLTGADLTSFAPFAGDPNSLFDLTGDFDHYSSLPQVAVSPAATQATSYMTDIQPHYRSVTMPQYNSPPMSATLWQNPLPDFQQWIPPPTSTYF